MKIKKFYLFICLMVAFSLTGCSAKETHAEPAVSPSSGSNRSAALGKLGFYVYEEPIDLPLSSVSGLTGNDITKSDFIGKITLLNFWATWCPPCRAEMPSIERLYDRMKGTQFQIIAVNAGEKRAHVVSFLEKNKYTFPVYLDESNDVSPIFTAQGIPSTYIVDKKGKVIAARIGAMEYDQAALITLFKELANE